MHPPRPSGVATAYEKHGVHSTLWIGLGLGLGLLALTPVTLTLTLAPVPLRALTLTLTLTRRTLHAVDLAILP
mgnify:CR=1 FL=1